MIPSASAKTARPISRLNILPALRAIPNVHVFRPADAVEAAECWQAALEHTKGPSAMALTRQGLPTLRVEHTDENLSAKGAYVLAAADGDRQATILATGSEVEIAMNARDCAAGRWRADGGCVHALLGAFRGAVRRV